MKFIGTPNLFVRITSKSIQEAIGKKAFYFDENGEYETDNEVLIKALSQHYSVNLKQCKKCDFTCENQGELLSHYRTHKKEGT